VPVWGPVPDHAGAQGRVGGGPGGGVPAEAGWRRSQRPAGGVQRPCCPRGALACLPAAAGVPRWWVPAAALPARAPAASQAARQMLLHPTVWTPPPPKRAWCPQEELRAGEEIARCPSCSLYITVIYNPVRAGPLRTALQSCTLQAGCKRLLHRGGGGGVQVCCRG
jgi:hypothetical protein